MRRKSMSGAPKLELYPTKTKIVCCRDGKRRGKYPNVKFDFLGYLSMRNIRFDLGIRLSATIASSDCLSAA
jgi:hypothetical protein